MSKKRTIPMALARSGLRAAMALIPPIIDVESNSVSTSQAYGPIELESALAIQYGSITLDPRNETDVNRPAEISIPRDWDTAAARLFDRLTEKEVLGSATQDELAELESLSNLRRHSEMPRTGAEIVREYEQGQLIRNLLQSLSRYVAFEQKTLSGASSSRSRTKAKA